MEFDGAIVFEGAIESLVPIVLAFFFFVFFIGLAGAIASLFMASLPPIESFVSMVFAGAMLLLGAHRVVRRHGVCGKCGAGCEREAQCENRQCLMHLHVSIFPVCGCEDRARLAGTCFELPRNVLACALILCTRLEWRRHWVVERGLRLRNRPAQVEF